MRIKLWIADLDDTTTPLQELGTCLTDNPGRAAQQYEQQHRDDLNEWAGKDYRPGVYWEDVTNPAAAALGRSTSERKTAAARENARKGGWPKGRSRKPVVE